ESSRAIQHWWGVNGETVWRWRKALGVEGPAGTEGSRRLIQAVAEAGGAVLRGKKRPPDQVERQRQTRRALGLRPTGRWKGREWTKAQLRLLGKVPDAELAERFGRTKNAVRLKRERLGLAKMEDRRRRSAGQVHEADHHGTTTAGRPDSTPTAPPGGLLLSTPTRLFSFLPMRPRFPCPEVDQPSRRRRRGVRGAPRRRRRRSTGPAWRVVAPPRFGTASAKTLACRAPGSVSWRQWQGTS